MLIVAVAWLYVVFMMAVVEATGPSGSLLGASITLMLYGVLPLSIALYLLGTSGRRARRQAQEASVAALDPDGRSHPAGDALAPERKEP